MENLHSLFYFYPMRTITHLFLFVLLFSSYICLFSQSQDSIFIETRALSGKPFVKKVIKDFYKIYSINFDSAINLTSEAKELALEEEWYKEAAYASLSNGVANYLRGDYKKALPAMLFSARTFDSLKLDSGIARVHNELAVYYRKNNEIEKALKSLEISEAAAMKAGDKEALGTSYGHQAAFLSREGKWDEALPYVEKTLAIRIEEKDSVGLGYIYLDLAEHAMHRGDSDEAFDFVQKSTDIRKAIGDDQGVAVNSVINGEQFFAMEKYAKAIPCFAKTIELAKPIGYTDLIRFSYDMLQQSYIKIGDYKNAYLSLQQNRIFNDSIFNVERSRALLDMETKYETEKKEQQIALQEAQLSENEAEIERNRFFTIALVVVIVSIIALWLLNRNRLKKKQLLLVQQERLNAREAEINATISSQEKERARYARDLHDGFGQMISILNMNLGSLRNDAKPDDRQKVFEESEKIINEMYDELKGICFDLMPQTLVKNGLTSGLEEFAERINLAGKIFIETNFFGLEERLAELQEISIYRICQEWINNILKYSDADKITLQITKDADEITLLIEDNGTGFEKSLLVNSKGNGWKNLKSRSNLIQGQLELETEVGKKGNTLIVNAPALLKSKNQEIENTISMV